MMDKEFLSVAARILKVKPEALYENSTAGTVPEWDSLSHWLVIAGLEAHYSIELTLEEATQFKNLGDIYNTIMSKLS